jgi:hypothetical protein
VTLPGEEFPWQRPTTGSGSQSLLRSVEATPKRSAGREPRAKSAAPYNEFSEFDA